MNNFFEKKDLLAVLPTDYRKSLNYQLHVVERKIMHHMLVITHLFRIINEQIMEVEAMNLTGLQFGSEASLFERHRRRQI